MTPTKFLQDRNIVAEDKTDLIIGLDNGTKESLIELLESYHQAKLKLLGIGDVVGRSEQLKAEVFTLANKLAVAGEGDAAVAMHKIHNRL